MSFLTGSRVYGKPTEDSDFDIVVRVTKEEKEMIEMSLGFPVKQGKVNLILVDNDETYQTWKDGTDYLKGVGPVDRETAIDYFDSIGIKRLYPAGMPSGQEEPFLE